MLTSSASGQAPTISYALVLFFPDRAAHDAYQTHPVHDRFREQCSTFWRKVLIYDSVDV